EGRALPVDQLVGIEVEADEQSLVGGEAPGDGAARGYQVGVSQPQSAQPDAPLVLQAERAAEPTGADDRVVRRRGVAADRGRGLPHGPLGECRDGDGCQYREKGRSPAATTPKAMTAGPTYPPERCPQCHAVPKTLHDPAGRDVPARAVRSGIKKGSRLAKVGQ